MALLFEPTLRRPRPAAETIVMLTCQYDEILGGAEKQCANLTRRLRERGAEVAVLTSRVPSVPVPDVEVGVKRFWTYCPPQLAGRYLPASLLWAFQVFIWIALNRRRILVLHCHQLRINAYVAALANALFGIPTVMKLGVGGELNDFYITSQRKYLLGTAGTRFIIRHTTRVVATAQQIYEDSLAWGVEPERIVRIVNGVNLDAVRDAVTGADDPRLKTLEERTRLIFVGRLSEEKNIELITEAVCELGDGRKIEFEILGEGPLAGRISCFSPASADVEIVMCGRVQAVFEHLRGAHFLLLLSSSEGLSNALLEAATAGVVPIVSDASGNRDVLPFPDYPFFVRSDQDLAAVIEMTRSMTSAAWRGWSERIATMSRARYDADAVGDRYMTLYREITQPDPKRCPA